MDLDKALICGASGVGLGLAGAAIWTAVSAKKRALQEELDEAGVKPDTAIREGKPVVKYAPVLLNDGPLVDALDTLQHSLTRSDRRQFARVVGSLVRQANRWMFVERADPAAFADTKDGIVKEAYDMAAETRQLLTEYCLSAGVSMRESTNDPRMRSVPVNPTHNRAFVQVLTSSDNFRHNTQVAFDIKRAAATRLASDRPCPSSSRKQQANE